MAELPKMNYFDNELLDRYMKYRSLILIGLFYFSFSTIIYSAGTTGAEFLTMGAGARPSSMGQAFTAVADDINAVNYNPAGVSQIKQNQILLMHNELLLDTKYEFAGFVHPTEESGSFGFNVAHLHQGTIVGRSVNGQKTEDFTAYDSAMTFSYGNNIYKNFSTGLNFKLIKQQIAQVSASGFAFDFGTLYKMLENNLNLSVAVQNLGPGIKFVKEKTPLPTQLSFGCAYKLKGLMVLAADYNMPVNDKPYFCIGTEYSLISMFSLRSGLSYQKNLGSPLKLSYGVGINRNNIGFDYGFTPFDDLGSTHRISLKLSFGKIK